MFQVKNFMSEKLCQDPLGNFYGCQQQREKSNENPNLQEFLEILQHWEQSTHIVRMLVEIAEVAVSLRENFKMTVRVLNLNS